MEDYSSTPRDNNHEVTFPRGRRPWGIRARIRRTWGRNPNAKAAHRRAIEHHGCTDTECARHRKPRCSGSRRRSKDEVRLTRFFIDQPALVIALDKLYARSNLAVALQLRTQLELITPEGLGLMWYTPRFGGGKGHRRVYLPGEAKHDARAALALGRAIHHLLERQHRDALRESRRELAHVARLVARDQVPAWARAAGILPARERRAVAHPQSAPVSDSPDLSSVSTSIEVETEQPSTRPLPRWLQAIRERHAGDELPAKAM